MNDDDSLYTEETKPYLNIRKYPEAKIQKAIIEFMEARGWYCKVIPGNATISGMPDLYTFHPKYRQRWVECKNPEKYAFTKQQIINFPEMSKFGVGIWILTAATQEEYEKLWKQPNWHEYLSVNQVRTRRVKEKEHNYVPKFPTIKKNTT